MTFFFENLEKFKPYEIEAAKRIIKLNNVEVKKWCNNYKYDFKTSDNLKYEVKTEPMSLKTGNFFIEFYGYGKKTGITITKANFYIISDTINYYLINVNVLKEIIDNNKFPMQKTRDKTTIGYLVSKNIIIENSIII
jgi:hypothetical protein